MLTPPYMNEKGDGAFIFHDVHIEGCTLEVVPQLSGNVDITINYAEDGHMLTLSHLDRADLLRALLHEFHYSRETGGPGTEPGKSDGHDFVPSDAGSCEVCGDLPGEEDHA